MAAVADRLLLRNSHRNPFCYVNCGAMKNVAAVRRPYVAVVDVLVAAQMLLLRNVAADR